MKYVGAPDLSLWKVAIFLPIGALFVIPLLVLLTLFTFGIFRGMDMLEDFLNWLSQ